MKAIQTQAVLTLSLGANLKNLSSEAVAQGWSAKKVF